MTTVSTRCAHLFGPAIALLAVGCATGSDMAPPGVGASGALDAGGDTSVERRPDGGHHGADSASDASSSPRRDASALHDATSHDSASPVDSARIPDAEAPVDAAPTFQILAVVDGTSLTPVNASAFADEAHCGTGGYSVSIYFSGPDLGPQSRFGMCLTTVESGCTATQGIEWVPDDGTSDTYNDTGKASCGLDITELGPTEVVGSFMGTLTNYAVTPTTNLTVRAQFAVQVAPQ